MSGKGRKAEILFSVVDEAFFALPTSPVDILYKPVQPECNRWAIKGEAFPYQYPGGLRLFSAAPNAAKAGMRLPRMSSDFRDTALFDSVTTDENGHGQISVKLPDNLTKWRVTFLGITKDLYAGMASSM